MSKRLNSKKIIQKGGSNDILVCPSDLETAIQPDEVLKVLSTILNSTDVLTRNAVRDLTSTPAFNAEDNTEKSYTFGLVKDFGTKAHNDNKVGVKYITDKLNNKLSRAELKTLLTSEEFVNKFIEDVVVPIRYGAEESKEPDANVQMVRMDEVEKPTPEQLNSWDYVKKKYDIIRNKKRSASASASAFDEPNSEEVEILEAYNKLLNIRRQEEEDQIGGNTLIGGAKKSSKRVVKKVSKKPSKKVVKKVSKKSSKTLKGGAKKVSKKPSKKVSKKPSKKVVKKVSKKSSKTLKGGAKKVSKKPSKKVSKKPSNKVVKNGYKTNK